MALVKGEIKSDQPVLVRVHMENTLFDVLASSQSSGWPLRAAMKQIAESNEAGVVVILRQPQDARDIVQWMLSPHEAMQHEAHASDLRTHGVGAQILMDLNVHKMRLMTAPKRIHGLAGFGLEVVDYVAGKD
jgi:3,4-dihydroxy 2-butanone 4-phosphate synthase/GTP cyclohydrolase II